MKFFPLFLASLITPALVYAQPTEEPVATDVPAPAPETPASAAPAAPEETPSPPPPVEPRDVDTAGGRRINKLPCDKSVRYRPHIESRWPELRVDRCLTLRPAFPVWADHPAFDLELVTQARNTVQDGDDLYEIRLDRAEAGIRLPIGGWLMANVRAEAVRSAADGGALGIDGDSTVLRVKYANVMAHGELGRVDFEGGAGFLPDPWIQSLETSYSLKPLSRTGSERLLGWQTADLAMMVRGAYGPVRLTFNVGNGEGQRYPERNNGKTTTGLLEVVALHTDAARVTLFGMARDGSIGPARIRDKRVGGGATAVLDAVRGGVEAVYAWGIADRGDIVGYNLGGWAEANYQQHVFVGARASSLHYTSGLSEGRSTTFGGAISYGDTIRGAGDARVWLAIDRITSSGTAMPLAGADSGDATVIMLMLSGNAIYAPKGD